MATLTPEQFREKHARRLKGSIEDIRRGIQGVTEAPGIKAAEKADKMLANLTEAVTSGKWAANIASVSLEDWQDSMINKGLGRIPAGIDGAAAKVEAFADQLLAYQKSLKSEVDRMPDLTLEDSIAKMVAWTRGMSKFRFKK